MSSHTALLAQLKARPRLFIAIAAAIATGLVIPSEFDGGEAVARWLVAWNVGTWLYVVLTVVMMARSSHHHMRDRAPGQDEGKMVILALVVVSALASLAAIGMETAAARQAHGLLRNVRLALAGITLLSTWTFIQIMFTQHYAHDYYAALCRGERPGLLFPGDDTPVYGDFFYFAAVIGTSAQPADVAFVTKAMRRVGSVHCILAYLFNTTVLALLINIGAGLL